MMGNIKNSITKQSFPRIRLNVKCFAMLSDVIALLRKENTMCTLNIHTHRKKIDSTVPPLIKAAHLDNPTLERSRPS